MDVTGSPENVSFQCNLFGAPLFPPWQGAGAKSAAVHHVFSNAAFIGVIWLNT